MHPREAYSPRPEKWRKSPGAPFKPEVGLGGRTKSPRRQGLIDEPKPPPSKFGIDSGPKSRLCSSSQLLHNTKPHSQSKQEQQSAQATQTTGQNHIVLHRNRLREESAARVDLRRRWFSLLKGFCLGSPDNSTNRLLDGIPRTSRGEWATSLDPNHRGHPTVRKLYQRRRPDQPRGSGDTHRHSSLPAPSTRTRNGNLHPLDLRHR